LLIDHNFDPNRGERIIAAIGQGYAHIVKPLLERGVRPTAAMFKNVNGKLKSISYLGPRSLACKYCVLSYQSHSQSRDIDMAQVETGHELYHGYDSID